MKLIIQIPCYNEEKTLAKTISDLPKKIEGIDTIEIVVIDDGSNDKTSIVSSELGVNYVVSLNRNKGLATAFQCGIDKCLEQGADIIVNTDGDNQYKAKYIKELIKPILDKKADIVIGDRQVMKNRNMNLTKKIFQKLGSLVVSRLARSKIPDVTSGFRAYSRDAALNINVNSEYSYSLETLIDSGIRKEKIISIPIETNPKTRESRLFKNNIYYIKKSTSTIIRSFLYNKPLGAIFTSSLVFFGLVIIMLSLYLRNESINFLILALLFFITGTQLVIFSFIADSIANNKKTNDKILYRIKKNDYKKNN